MRKSYTFIAVLSLIASSVLAQFRPIQSDDAYKVLVDITASDAEKVTVEVVPPLQSLSGDSAIYAMARIIPGTYSISNYGQFVRDLTALDQHGDTLESIALDANRWYFPKANKVYKISYSVVETFAHSEGAVFEPSGTTFRDSVSLLNLFAMVGYMQNNGQYSYELTIQKPREFYGAGNLEAISREIDRDEFVAPNYFFLHDNPLMYCRPDTASVELNGTRVHLAVYSAEGINTAEEILPDITNLFQAAVDYFDGYLPVDNYHILLFLEDPNSIGTSFGALEHHYSTVVYMPDYPLEAIRQNIRDIVAHEFLHIVTPLNFHSEVVHNFNFQNPEMTRHLWLYEGVTEYTSHLMQVRGGLIDEEDFLDEMREKMQGADEYNPLVPMTTASRYALTIHEDQYLNVYQKGALVAMCIDLQLIAATNGEMDLKDLMVKLSNTYGPDTFFTDHRLFDIIAEHGFPGIHDFAAQHIEASLPLPFDDLLEMVGYAYAEDGESMSISFGMAGFGIDMEDAVLVIEDMEDADEVALDLGYKVGDKIMKLNGSPMGLMSIERTLSQFFQQAQVGDDIEIEIQRPNKKQTKWKTKTLKSKVREIEIPAKHLIRALEEYDDPNRTRLRNKWLTNQ